MNKVIHFVSENCTTTNFGERFIFEIFSCRKITLTAALTNIKKECNKLFHIGNF